MIIIKINDKEYSVKTEWNEFNYVEYCNVIKSKEKSLIEKTKDLTGIPTDLINKLNYEQLSFLGDALAFTDEPDNIHLFTIAYTDDLNIGKRKYKEIEQALIFIRKTDKPVLVLNKVIEIYYGENIDQLKAVECLGKGFHLLNLISKFLKEFEELGEYEPSVQEIEAGVDELNKFGFFATAVQYARKYGKTHDEILDMPAREVYTTLLYDYKQSQVEKRLQEIHSRKK